MATDRLAGRAQAARVQMRAWLDSLPSFYETDMGKEEELHAAVLEIERKLGRKLDDLEERLGGRIGRLVTRLDAIEDFADGLESQLEKLRERQN